MKPGPPPGPYLVAGLGRAGRAAVPALARFAGAAAITAWDRSRTRELERVGARLAADGVRVSLGGDAVALLDGVRTVVKSPGVRMDAPLIEAARQRGILTVDELELGWRLLGAPVAAVTGTNGKSTVAKLVAEALEAAGRAPLLGGNTELGPPLSAFPPDHRGWVVAEVSSYQAEGCPRFLPDAAVFTNLTVDHLHRHGSMAAYAETKRRLFVRGDDAVPLAVLNADDPFGRELARAVRARGGTALTYGRCATAGYRVGRVTSHTDGATVPLETPLGPLVLETRLPGGHNALNVAAALALADGLAVERGASAPALEAATPVPGRFERVSAGQPFEVVVDFAHTPDGVAKTLATARELASGRVVTVLGAVASTHPPTRELLGRAARTGSDVLILCASSLHGEPGLVALRWILAGARSVVGGGTLSCVLDRRAAIERAVELARPGDVVVILGRGPLTRMAHDRHGGATTLDDRAVARAALS